MRGELDSTAGFCLSNDRVSLLATGFCGQGQFISGTLNWRGRAGGRRKRAVRDLCLESEKSGCRLKAGWKNLGLGQPQGAVRISNEKWKLLEENS